jgi:hypothetical protein
MSDGSGASKMLEWQQLANTDLNYAWISQQQFAIATPDQHARLPQHWSWQSLAPAQFKDNEGLMPYLLDIAALTEPSKLELITMLQVAHQDKDDTPLSVLLSAVCSSSEMVRHLRQVQVLATPQGIAWLRVIDGRVWAQLSRIVEAAKMKRLFGPISSWTCCLNGNWVRTQLAPENQHTQNHPQINMDGLFRVGLINRTLAREGLLSWQDTETLSAKIDKLICRAQQRYHLTSTEDIVSFAAFGVRYGVTFDQHPLVQRRITPQQKDNADDNLIDLLALIDEDEWATVAQAPSLA